MASSASALLKLELQANGENDTTWGDKANAVFERLEESIADEASVSLASADATLTDTQFVENEARKAVVNATGTLTANRNIIVPARTKLYLARNTTSGAFTVTVKTSAGTGVTVRQGGSRWVFCDATNVVGGPDLLDDETPQLGGNLDANSKNINETKSSNLASATTTDLSTTTGNFVDVTGTTTITAFGTVAAGAHRIVRFTGVLTLTHNAASLILPGGANITTANGDVAHMRSLGSGNWVCVNYMKASGTAVIAPGSVITTQGDIVRGDSGGNEERLALGTNGQTLISNGTTVVWGAPGQSDVITTRGDMIRGDSAGAAERLALGSNGQVLTSDGVDITWAANAAQADVITTRGDVVIGNASGAAARLGIGASGQVLESDGTDVTWGGQKMSDVFTTRGDIARAGVGGAEERLALGTSGQVLKSDGTDAAWAAEQDISGKADTTTTMTAGTGLTGGGSLAANRTFNLAAGSDTAIGGLEIAVQSEMETGTDNTRAVVPGRQHFHSSAVKGWGNADMTTPALGDSYNVTSLTDAGVGKAQFNWTNNMSSTTYGALMGGIGGGTGVCVTTAAILAASMQVFRYIRGSGAFQDGDSHAAGASGALA